MASKRRSREPGPPTPAANAVEERMRKLVQQRTAHLWEEAGAELAREHAREAAQQRARNLERVHGIKDHVRAALIAGDPLIESEAVQVARGWYLSWRNATSRNAMVIAGVPGVGKTVAGQWLLARVPGVSWEAEFACKAYAAKFGPELERLQASVLQPMFVLEDVGTEQDEIVMGALLVWVFNERQRSDLHTLITANTSKRLFWARYADPRLQSRMHEVDYRSVEGEDLRRLTPEQLHQRLSMLRKQRRGEP